MDYIRCFEDCLVVDEPTAAVLEDLTRCKPSTATVQKLIEYCTSWCCLAQFLYRYKPPKVKQQLQFIVGNRHTNSYSVHLLFYTLQCQIKTLEFVCVQLGLEDGNTIARVSTTQFTPVQRIQCMQMINRVIGLVYFCNNTVLLECVHR